MNAVRPYTFALVVVCVVAASTVFQLQQLVKSSCTSSTAIVPTTNKQSDSKICVHSVDSRTVGPGPLGLSTHRTKPEIRLGVLLRPHSFELSKSLLKQTDQIVKQSVCRSQPPLTDAAECIQSIRIDYFVSTRDRFYAHERVHKLPSSRRSSDNYPSMDWFDRNKRHFAHMDAVIFEGLPQSPNQKQNGLAAIPLHNPSDPAPSPSYLSPNSSVYLLTLRPTHENQQTQDEKHSSLQFSAKPSRWSSSPHTNRTHPTSHKEPAAEPTPAFRYSSDSWVDHFMAILDDLVFGFDVESAEALGYDDAPADSEQDDITSLKPSLRVSHSESGHDHSNTDRDGEVDMEIASSPDMSGDQFQWLLRVVVMVAWLHMFWDQL